MYLLKSNIFKYFGLRDYNEDLYKDVSGKGLKQRFNELLAGDLDDSVIILMDQFLENLIDPTTILSKYFELRGEDVGSNLYYGSDEDIRRKFLRYIMKLYKIKSTILGYEIMFRMVGITGAIIITEYENKFGFDNPDLTLDDENRIFDMSNGYSCYRYTIDLTGTAVYTLDLFRAIKSVILFNEPIYAKLKWVKYNGLEINVESTGSFNLSFSESFSS